MKDMQVELSASMSCLMSPCLNSSKGVIYRGLYGGVLRGLLRGILRVYTIAFMRTKHPTSSSRVMLSLLWLTVFYSPMMDS